MFDSTERDAQIRGLGNKVHCGVEQRRQTHAIRS